MCRDSELGYSGGGEQALVIDYSRVSWRMERLYWSKVKETSNRLKVKTNGWFT
jgi:hypothetical protein